jgi:hypothetical protein
LCQEVSLVKGNEVNLEEQHMHIITQRQQFIEQELVNMIIQVPGNSQ